MFEVLLATGIPIFVVISIGFLWFFLQEYIKTNLNKYASIEEDLLRRELKYLDQQLNEFYLPIKERLALSNQIYNTGEKNLIEKNGYDNSTAGVISKNKNALRNIIVQRVYMPLNSEVGKLILNKSYLKDNNDNTDYSNILTHFWLWKAFEEAMIEGDIKDYNAPNLLQFPAQEVKQFNKIYQKLLKKRNRYRKKIEDITNVIMSVKQSKKRWRMNK